MTETDEDGNQTYIDWVYDELGRLVFEESYSELLPARNYVDEYQYDLVGNRLTKDHDSNGDGIVDEAITYLYDANDRLLVETRDDLTVADDDGYTHYEYGPNADPGNGDGGDHTVQTLKTVYDDQDTPLTKTEYFYDLQGRLSKVEIDSDADSNIDTTLDYTYDDQGIRVSVTEKIDGNDDGDLLDPEDSTTTTDNVIDANNPTGYAQVLEEKDGSGNVTMSYTLGHDVIAQQSPSVESGDTLFLLYDGHGSTRALLNSSGAIVTGQVFHYDAYGNAVGFDAASALTTILYCGEHFDVATDQLYLRTRYYDAAMGRFNRFDDFTGDPGAPQSLHKYAYAHDDPITYNDPSGQFVGGLVGMLGSVMRGMVNYGVPAAIGASFLRLVEFAIYGNGGGPPSWREQRRIEDADRVIAATPHFEGYAWRRQSTNTLVFEGGPHKWGQAFHLSRTVLLSKKLLQEVDTPFLASTIVHEIHHTYQAPFYKGLPAGEAAAYQAQSDFLRAMGIHGHVQSMYRAYPNTRDAYFNDLSKAFEDFNVHDPAIVQ